MSDHLRFIDIGCIATLEDPDGWKYRAVETIERADSIFTDGTDEETPTAQELMSNRRSQTDSAKQWILALSGPDDTVQSSAGWANVQFPLDADLEKANIYVCVHPENRRHGIGSALLDWCEDRAREAGRTEVFMDAGYGSADDHEPYLSTAEGGQVPQDAPCVSFPQAKGYVVDHAARRSVLDLPMAPGLFDTLLSDALPYTAGYRLHTWENEIPQEWMDSFARLREAFSRDIPQGQTTWDEETWDVDRVQRMLDEIHDQGRTVLFTAAEHIATSQLVGFTEFRWPDSKPCVSVDQWLTIVSGGHRGHRLGMWMKLINLAALVERNPSVRNIHTDNAQENSPMLNINIAMGFHPCGGYVLTRKTLL